jgi:hypothetical protein
MATNLIKMFFDLIFIFSMRGNNKKANDLAQYGLRFKMVFNDHDIILMKIIDQSNIIDVQQKCHDEHNNANSMVKKICKTVTISLFLKFSTKYKQRVLTILVLLILKD